MCVALMTFLSLLAVLLSFMSSVCSLGETLIHGARLEFLAYRPYLMYMHVLSLGRDNFSDNITRSRSVGNVSCSSVLSKYLR